ncbi:hypothetical protein BP5796_05545 [Coleophoma crateriformis]|uniref:Uncharacterized protein n=1 Tax=Coleophoma crateriformis TaxID=565419 RepID=A0A3D8S3G2_9HELO|nr:hypothetical protein BP5796_05545 [Coleophoma crateriformis]
MSAQMSFAYQTISAVDFPGMAQCNDNYDVDHAYIDNLKFIVGMVERRARKSQKNQNDKNNDKETPNIASNATQEGVVRKQQDEVKKFRDQIIDKPKVSTKQEEEGLRRSFREAVARKAALSAKTERQREVEAQREAEVQREMERRVETEIETERRDQELKMAMTGRGPFVEVLGPCPRPQSEEYDAWMDRATAIFIPYL